MDPLDPHAEEPTPVDTAAARIGTHLNVQWRLDDLLGVGGMGAVFAATHRSGSRAALKVLHLEFARDPDLRDRFLREGKIANRVEHPARVAVLDDDLSDRGEPFLVMELLAGTTLQRLASRSGGMLPLEQVLPIFDVVLDLLEQCHAVGVIHRDIKPANIFVTSAGDVKVLDFGVARMRDPQLQATRAGLTFGTPAFMSPEQAMGLSGIDGRADLFSVGACIFNLLSGKRLNRGRSEAESYFLAATQAAPSIASEVSDLPVEIVAFVDKALAFERSGRFQSAAVMRAELRRLSAAHAAGKLTAAREKKAPRVLVRGNDAIDEEAEPRAAAQGEQTCQRLVSVWKQLALVLSNIRQYGWNHPHVNKGLHFAFDEITRALAQSPISVRWEVTPNAFTFGGQPIWLPDRPPFDGIPYQLFADGIRKIQIKPGITEAELRDFAAILLRDQSFGLGEDDDSVTALWDRRFEHIAYMAIDLFAEGDAMPEEDFEEQCSAIAGEARAIAQIEGLWDETSLAGRALQKNLEAALEETGTAASVLAVDPLTRGTLCAQIALPAEQWSERYMDAFVDGYFDAVRHGDVERLTSALTSWTSDQIVLHSYELAFEVQAMLRRAFAARLEAPPPGGPAGRQGDAAQRPSRRELDQMLTNAMFPVEALRAILDDLSAHGPDDAAGGAAAHGAPARIAAPLDPATVEGLALALEALEDGSLFTAACACYGAVQSERLRDVLLAYMRRWAPGREREAGDLLARAPVSLAAALIQLLARQRTPEALGALEAGFTSPHVEVRISALAEIPDAVARDGATGAGAGSAVDRVRDELQKLLDDPAPQVRREALRMIAKLGVLAAGPTLVRRIVSPSFHDLPSTERRQWLDTVAHLNPGRAEKLAIELLEKRQLIPSEAIEQTREMAALFLCQARSYEALRAVKEATKPRWWNTPPVRDAAARAAVAIAARLVAPSRPSDRPQQPEEMPPSRGPLPYAPASARRAAPGPLEPLEPWSVRPNASAPEGSDATRPPYRPTAPGAPLSGSPGAPLSGSPGAPLSGSPGAPLSGSPSMPLSGSLSMPLPGSPGAPLSGSPSMPLPGSPGAPLSSSTGMPLSGPSSAGSAPPRSAPFSRRFAPPPSVSSTPTAPTAAPPPLVPRGAVRPGGALSPSPAPPPPGAAARPAGGPPPAGAPPITGAPPSAGAPFSVRHGAAAPPNQVPAARPGVEPAPGPVGPRAKPGAAARPGAEPAPGAASPLVKPGPAPAPRGGRKP